MSKLTLGQRVPSQKKPGEQDAAHVPVIVCTAAMALHAGDRIVFTGIIPYHVRKQTDSKKPYHGIVDPFIETAVDQNAAVHVLLSPNVTGEVTHQFKINVDMGVPAQTLAYAPEEDDDDGGGDWCDREGC